MNSVKSACIVPALLLIAAVCTAAAGLISPPDGSSGLAPETDHPLISEVYADAYSENNSEFVELFNPTDFDIDISGWDLWDGNGVEAEIPAGVIPAHGYFLVADGGWSTGRDDPGWPSADVEDEMALTNTNHGIALRDAADIVIDALGWGTPDPGEPFEGTPIADPTGSGYSFERLPYQDTDDNSVDFFENPFIDVNPENSGTPCLDVDPVDIDLGREETGVPFSAVFTVFNTGSGTLDVVITESADWITSVTPAEFSLSEFGEELVTVDGVFPEGAGEFGADIDVASNGGGDTVYIHGSIDTGIIRVPEDYATIQAAIDASDDGDSILVASGTYTGIGNTDIDFDGHAVTLQGGRDGRGESVIDCEGSHRGFLFINGEDETSVLEGFTIRNGDMDEGGGIYCAGSSPVLRNLVIENNSSRDGGGVYLVDSSPELTGSTISGNRISGLGAGIYCEGGSPVLSGNIITGNRASDYGGGGGIGGQFTEATITGNLIADNYASEGGGGLWFQGYSTLVIEGNTVSGNDSGEGGGIYLQSPAAISNNMITGNTGWRAGGIYCVGSHSVSIVHNTVSENISDSEGGGLYCGIYSSPTVTNTILWGNEASAGAQIYCAGGSVTVTWSDVEGGWTGDGNIDADPLFADPAGGDFHLAIDSPCIDTGLDAGVYDDIDGDTRPLGDGFDMGADEYVPAAGLEVFLADYPGSIAPGETLVFTAGAVNNGAEEASFDYANLAADGPASTVRQLYSGPPLILGAGEEVSTAVSLFVPGNTPLGWYTITVEIALAGEPVASASFDIEVVAAP